MDMLIEFIVSFLLIAAGLFAIVGSWGLIKLPDLMTRLHAPTKATTLGVGGVLMAAVIWKLASGHGFSSHELLITLFLFITAPVTANFIAKNFLHHEVGSRGSLPPAHGKAAWATFEEVEQVEDDPLPIPTKTKS